jgi:hypothetical protein
MNPSLFYSFWVDLHDGAIVHARILIFCPVFVANAKSCKSSCATCMRLKILEKFMYTPFHL